MSYFSEVTHTECVNRMIVVKDSAQERTATELRAIRALPSAIEEYLARGGKIKTLPPMAMQDPESEYGIQARKDSLRQYDRHREIEQMKANKRAGK